jgi:hypothetical protein
MSETIEGTFIFTLPSSNINSEPVDGVNNMSYMFYKANIFNQPIGNWDVSGVNNMNSMFNHALKFNQDI